MAEHRHQVPGGFVPEHPAKMRRVSDRTADVAADLQPGEPGGQCCGRTARRAARCAAGIPGVVGRAIDVVVALEVGEPDRDVGLAEDVGAGCRQALHRQRILVSDVVAQLGDAPGGRHAAKVVAFLDGHRHTVQRTHCLPAFASRIGRIGACAGAFAVLLDDGVERWIEATDAGQKMFEKFACADSPLAQFTGQCACRAEMQIGHGGLLGIGAVHRVAGILADSGRSCLHRADAMASMG